MRVLLIDADQTVARALCHLLKGSGAIVEHAATGEDGLDLLRHYDFDLVLLDLALPGTDGCELVRRMRAARIDTPAIVMVPQARADAKLRAFGVGADDVIAKPFDPAELLARMQAILRRSKGYSQPTLVLGDLQLNLDSREVLVAGVPVHLTGKEYGILELLVLRKGMVLTKEAFLNHLYGGMDEPEMKIIDVFICKLRRKLSDAGAPNVIATVWGRGYMVRDTVAPSPVTAPRAALAAKKGQLAIA